MTPHPARPAKPFTDPTDLRAELTDLQELLDVDGSTDPKAPLRDRVAAVCGKTWDSASRDAALEMALATIGEAWEAVPDDVVDADSPAEAIRWIVAQRDEAREQRDNAWQELNESRFDQSEARRDRDVCSTFLDRLWDRYGEGDDWTLRDLSDAIESLREQRDQARKMADDMSAIPDPQTYLAPDGQVEIVQGDGHGNHVTVVASPGAQPWLVRCAMRATVPHLMPGAREAKR